MAKKIQVAEVLPVSEVNGPGCRSVIWVQGCAKRCPGCWNPDYLKFKKARWSIAPEELFNLIREKTNDFDSIEGITFSGGEPFEQAIALSESAYLFKRQGLSLMSYSGYTIEEIRSKNEPFTGFLVQLDILVDGEYKKELHCDLSWRSSSNQKVHFLTDRYRSDEKKINDAVGEFEVTIKPGKYQVTGFPQLALLRNLQSA